MQLDAIRLVCASFTLTRFTVEQLSRRTGIAAEVVANALADNAGFFEIDASDTGNLQPGTIQHWRLSDGANIRIVDVLESLPGEDLVLVLGQVEDSSALSLACERAERSYALYLAETDPEGRNEAWDWFVDAVDILTHRARSPRYQPLLEYGDLRGRVDSLEQNRLRGPQPPTEQSHVSLS